MGFGRLHLRHTAPTCRKNPGALLLLLPATSTCETSYRCPYLGHLDIGTVLHLSCSGVLLWGDWQAPDGSTDLVTLTGYRALQDK